MAELVRVEFTIQVKVGGGCTKDAFLEGFDSERKYLYLGLKKLGVWRFIKDDDIKKSPVGQCTLMFSEPAALLFSDGPEWRGELGDEKFNAVFVFVNWVKDCCKRYPLADITISLVSE